jgi:hypothetical protein
MNGTANENGNGTSPVVTYLLLGVGAALGAVAAVLLVHNWPQVKAALPEDCPVCRVLGIESGPAASGEASDDVRIVLAD